MKLKELTSILEKWAPLEYQESYDNSGLIVGDPNIEITGALLTLDSTEEVVDEAIKKGANLIIAHHPILFGGIKQLNGKNYVERTIIKAIKNDIAIYAFHTNLDAVINGVNSKISDKLNLINRSILKKRKENNKVGSGMIGDLKTPINELEFLSFIKKEFKAGSLRYTNILNKDVVRVAVCGGSGSFLLEDAIREGADVFVTSDFKYHQYFDAENKIVIADIGHYEAEICTQQLIYEYLNKKISTFTLHFSDVNTNPINYL
tara:strand:+ start:2411 stop:3193 length:783 start_codon:yes stop_codon:yes gene_type:complete